MQKALRENGQSALPLGGSRVSLPKPIGRQKEVLYLPAVGHFVVLGTAGSGKTTLAILRSAYLADPSTDHGGKTLLVTFNRALVSYLRHLQDQALREVVVENYHTFARGYLKSVWKMPNNGICGDPDERQRYISEAIQQVASKYKKHSFFGQRVELFSEEIRWMDRQGISTLEAYQRTERTGRSGARFDRNLREPAFQIRETYRTIRAAAGKLYDWDDLASVAKYELDHDATPRRYCHVVIDEGQDFSPEMIRSLAAAIPPDGSLTFFGDVAQQIYGRRVSWRSAGMNITKVWEFKENYRNSKQIARLGLAISKMPYFRDLPDLVEPLAPAADGPRPTLVECSSHEMELDLVVKQAESASRTQSVAVLFRDREEDEKIVGPLFRGHAIRLHREMTTWQSGPGIWYGTYHSSKGLEFDTVILPFLSKERLPDPNEIDIFGADEAAVEDGRLLYVAVTRAKNRLILTYTGAASTLMPTDPGLYEVVRA